MEHRVHRIVLHIHLHIRFLPGEKGVSKKPCCCLAALLGIGVETEGIRVLSKAGQHTIFVHPLLEERAHQGFQPPPLGSEGRGLAFPCEPLII